MHRHRATITTHAQRHSIPWPRLVLLLAVPLLIGLFLWRWLALPGPLLPYVRGSFLPTVLLLAALATLVGHVYHQILLAMASAALTLLLTAIVNQAVLWLANLFGWQLSLLHQVPILSLALAFGLWVSMRSSVGMRRSFLLILWHALFTTTLLALFMKMESFPNVQPYADEAAWVTIITPAIYVMLAGLLITWRSQ